MTGLAPSLLEASSTPAPGTWVAALGGPGARPGPACLVAVDGPAPGLAEAQGCVAVLDGLVHSLPALQSEVGGAPGSPAEVVLQAYLRRGDGVLRHLRGAFALVVWDSRSRTIVAVRDPLGAYPLFYTPAGGGPTGPAMLFSTSTDALLRQPGVPRALNRPALAGLLCHEWPELEETYFAAIRRIPAGHVMRVDQRGSTVTRYWDPSPPDQPMRWVREEEMDRFETLLRQAVERGLALGPSAVLLSGGLDSVSVAAMAADAARDRQQPLPLALSVKYPEEAGNEETVQRGVARALGLPQVVQPFDALIDRHGMVRSTLVMSADWPWPVQNPWNPAYSRLSGSAVEQGSRVLFSGDGGDEWMAVSPLYAADLLRSGDARGLARFAAMTVRSYQMNARRAAGLLWTYAARALALRTAGQILRRVAPGVIVRRRRRRMEGQTPAWVAPDPGLRREFRARRERAIARLDPGPGPRQFYLRNMRGLLASVSRSMEREESFETGRRLGLHVVDPYWDVDLVDFLYRVPPDLLLWNGRSKGPARRFVARRLPGLGFEQQRKVTLSTYYRDRLHREIGEAWRHLGGFSALGAAGLVDPRGVDESMRRVMADPEAGDLARLVGVLNVEAWLRPRL